MDIKKLRRENDQLRREIWNLRDEYERLESLLKSQQEPSSEEEDEDEVFRWPLGYSLYYKFLLANSDCIADYGQRKKRIDFIKIQRIAF